MQIPIVGKGILVNELPYDHNLETRALTPTGASYPRKRFWFRYALVCGWILCTSVVIVTFFAHLTRSGRITQPAAVALGILCATVSALIVVLYLRFLPLHLTCPSCHKSIMTDAPWTCGYCGRDSDRGVEHINRFVIFFSFVNFCSKPGCFRAPPAYVCTNSDCRRQIQLGKRIFWKRALVAEYYEPNETREEREERQNERRRRDLERKKDRHETRKGFQQHDIDQVETEAEFCERRVDLERERVEAELRSQEAKYRKRKEPKLPPKDSAEAFEERVERRVTERRKIIAAADKLIMAAKSDRNSLSKAEELRTIAEIEQERDRMLSEL